MVKSTEVLKWANETLDLQAQSIAALKSYLSEDFGAVVQCILESNGRLVVTGIGKSAAIATKIVATLNSTGTPAIFMHAADAVHGDLGMIQQNDIVICISKSGNTPEIKALVPWIKSGGNTIVAMVGHLDSFLAQHADYIINTYVEKEACPNNLAPTTSTTAQLVLGDALAVCLLRARGFSSADFAKYHPGGALGKRLYTTVGELAGQNERPEVSAEAESSQVLLELSRGRMGAVAVTRDGHVEGIITDGDLRRFIGEKATLEGKRASDMMTARPVTVEASELAIEAARIMAAKKISQVIVILDGKYTGMVHIHDLNREGILI